MNHRGAEATEKKKKRSVSRWRYARLFVIALVGIAVVSLMVLTSLYSYNLFQYKHNRLLWDERSYGKVIFAYTFGYNGSIHASASYADSNDLWAMTFECVQRVFCKIQYNEQYRYPKYIYPKYNGILQIDESILVDKLFICGDEPDNPFCEVFDD
jgi:hypothetical protein